MPRLTKRIVDSARPNAVEYFVWDGDLPGFGLRVFPSGKKSYLVQYRVGRRSRRFTIGLHGPFTPDMARTEALAILAGVSKGHDPAERKAEKLQETTVAELCDLYLAEGCGHKKASTLVSDKSRVVSHIRPLLGSKLVSAVTTESVERFAADVDLGRTGRDVRTGKRGRSIVRGGSGTAARTLGLLGGIFTFAIKRKMRLDNPVHGVARQKAKKRTRFLSQSELAALGRALERAQMQGVNSSAIAAIRLLILTGCRRGEILSLKWSYIDWDNSCIRLPDSKTGQKTVCMASQAMSLLRMLFETTTGPYVLPSVRYDGHIIGLQKVWELIRSMANIPDVRIHDLRRSFASVAAVNGQSLLTIGKLLGHADPQTTQIYAHLTDKALQAAAESTATCIADAMSLEHSN